jgi:hypothetical protein
VTVPDRPQTPEERAARERPSIAALGPPLPAALDWEALEERGEPPPREWAIEHWIGMGHVTLLAGRGGIGKSIMAQQLGTALALGKDFVGQVKHPRVVLMWAGEDDHDELWRRQRAVCKRFDISLGALRGRFHVEPLAAVPCSLMEDAAGELVKTSILSALRDQIEKLKAEVVILDNIARLYGASENDRHAVSTFLSALNWAGESTGAAVLLLGHVAKSETSEYAGSTAWENACRGRLWLTDKPPDKKPSPDDEDDPIADLRYLAKRKVNYTSNDIATLRYVKDGESGSYEIVTPPAGQGSLVATIDHDRAKKVVVACLPRFKAMGIDPVESASSQHFLPKLIVGHGLAEGFPRHELTRAMRALMTDGILTRGQVGTYPNRTPRFGLLLATKIT